jgi:hypothetical protein
MDIPFEATTGARSPTRIIVVGAQEAVATLVTSMRGESICRVMKIIKTPTHIDEISREQLKCKLKRN